KDVPPNATVVGIPGTVVRLNGVKVEKLDHHKLPDPVAEKCSSLEREITRLKEELAKLEQGREREWR
ncbi:MAG TPA: serine O-acetyltransferase, partial [Sporosarcina sp.]|nr:serine O-acetyltransferase [Sporosarcina sp.]